MKFIIKYVKPTGRKFKGMVTWKAEYEETAPHITTIEQAISRGHYIAKQSGGRLVAVVPFPEEYNIKGDVGCGPLD